MNGSPTFSDVLAQPGPSAPSAPSGAEGAVVLNDHAKQAVLTSPLQQARVRKLTSWKALQSLAMSLAKGATNRVI